MTRRQQQYLRWDVNALIFFVFGLIIWAGYLQGEVVKLRKEVVELKKENK